MENITVIGVGPGHADYLTPAARQAAAAADVLLGSARALAPFKHLRKKKLS